MLYRVALGTGFRVSELASLMPNSFALDTDPPTVTVRAAYSKRRREDHQPIRMDLAELLRKWLQSKPADLPALKIPDKTAQMFRFDLRRAKARWIRSTTDRVERRRRIKNSFLNVVDDSGCVADFHALRATYITMLVKGGASVKVAQDLARHSDPKLTMNTYTKLGIHDLTTALESLPDASPSAPDRQALKATGTDDAKADPPQCPPQRKCELVLPDASECDKGKATSRTHDDHKPLPFADVCDTVQPDASSSENALYRTRTYDPLIKSQQGHSVTSDKAEDCSTRDCDPSCTPSNCVESCARDMDLQELVMAWGDLPKSFRTGITVLIRATLEEDDPSS